MLSRITLSCVLLIINIATCLAEESSSQVQNTELNTVKYLLRRATKLASEQDEAQRFWTERILLQIARVQIRAREFEGARQSILLSTYTSGRDELLVDLAKELAGFGKRQESLDVLRELSSGYEPRETLNDIVRLRWIEYLIATKDFKQSQLEVEQLEPKECRSEGYRILGIAHAKSGDKSKAARHLKLALDSAMNIDGDSRWTALTQIAKAQISVGTAEEAKVAVHHLIDSADKFEPWVEVCALNDAAVLSATLKDRQMAESLFQKALNARQKINSMNKVGSLELIATAQASAGYIDDALQTAGLLGHSKSDSSRDGARERILVAVVSEQLRTDNPDNAVRTALSIKHVLQYRDDALHSIAEYQVKKGDFKKGLEAAERFDNQARKASAILKVAIACAKSGDKKRAVEIASSIKLTSRVRIIGPEIGTFEYSQPETWSVNYESSTGFTMNSHLRSIELTSEVATLAVTLAHEITVEIKPNFGDLLNDVEYPEVILAMARTRTAKANRPDALSWIERIGSENKPTSNDDPEAIRALEKRINALIGIAEGKLDRLDNVKTNSNP